MNGINPGMPAGAKIGHMKGMGGMRPTDENAALEDTGRRLFQMSQRMMLDGLAKGIYDIFWMPGDQDQSDRLEAAIMECVCSVFNEDDAVPYSEEGLNTILTAFKGVLKTLLKQGGDTKHEG